MFGVILWSDHQSGAAVIWCEDRAELAYYEMSASGRGGHTAHTPACFDAGDLVQFDLCGTYGRRLEVSNLRAAPCELRHDMPPAVPGAREPQRRPRSLRPASGSVVDLRPARPVPGVPQDLSRRG